MPIIEKLTAARANALKPQLIELLQDAVRDGASIGFVSPLSAEVADQYWQDVIREVALGSRILLAAQLETKVAGVIQLGLCTKPNGRHRAEVQKLLVHTRARRAGLGRQLMAAIEAEAQAARRTLLYLDTEPHKPAEIMYRKSGWQLAGEIPNYACTPDGALHGTRIFYKNLPA